MQKNPLILIVPYLGSLLLQTKTKLQIEIKSQKKAIKRNLFLKITTLKDLLLESCIHFSVNSAMNLIMMNKSN